MSVNIDEMGGMETEASSYADHEVINLAIQTDGSDFDEFLSVEPLDDELERNQVAELVYYERNAEVSFGNFEFGLGYNVSEEDFIEQAAANQTDIQPSGDGAQLAIYEEPGIIDYTEIGLADDATNETQRREYPIKELFNHGPFVDSTDNLDLHVETASGGTGNAGDSSVQVQMIYAIHEVAQGVPQFSDPRRLMDD